MLAEPKCYARDCIWFLGVHAEGVEEKEVPCCVAFPKGIPKDIAYGNNLHTKPVKGDHGLLYEKRK